MWKVRKSTILLVLAGLMVVTVFSSEKIIGEWLERRQGLDFSRLILQTVARQKTRLVSGAPGYVIFYSDVVQCTGCFREVNQLKKIAEIYPEIGFYTVIKDEEHARAFVDALEYLEIPGQYLLDVHGRLQNRLALGDHPQLLFLDSKMKLIAILPLDVTHEDLVQQIHRYIAVM